MARFNVTYEITTPESAENGDSEETGFIVQDVGLREAIEAVQGTRTSGVDGVECIEANDSDIGAARWITVSNGMEFETGATESRSIHIPDNVTRASRIRIARILGAR